MGTMDPSERARDEAMVDEPPREETVKAERSASVRPTPGAWYVSNKFQDGQNHNVDVLCDGFRIGVAFSGWSSRMDVSLEEAEANARLFAAAKDLLAACEGALGSVLRARLHTTAPDVERVDCLRAAIAKATGARIATSYEPEAYATTQPAGPSEHAAAIEMLEPECGQLGLVAGINALVTSHNRFQQRAYAAEELVTELRADAEQVKSASPEARAWASVSPAIRETIDCVLESYEAASGFPLPEGLPLTSAGVNAARALLKSYAPRAEIPEKISLSPSEHARIALLTGGA